LVDVRLLVTAQDVTHHAFTSSGARLGCFRHIEERGYDSAEAAADLRGPRPKRAENG